MGEGKKRTEERKKGKKITARSIRYTFLLSPPFFLYFTYLDLFVGVLSLFLYYWFFVCLCVFIFYFSCWLFRFPFRFGLAWFGLDWIHWIGLDWIGSNGWVDVFIVFCIYGYVCYPFVVGRYRKFRCSCFFLLRMI